MNIRTILYIFVSLLIVITQDGTCSAPAPVTVPTASAFKRFSSNVYLFGQRIAAQLRSTPKATKVVIAQKPAAPAVREPNYEYYCPSHGKIKISADGVMQDSWTDDLPGEPSAEDLAREAIAFKFFTTADHMMLPEATTPAQEPQPIPTLTRASSASAPSATAKQRPRSRSLYSPALDRPTSKTPSSVSEAGSRPESVLDHLITANRAFSPNQNTPVQDRSHKTTPEEKDEDYDGATPTIHEDTSDEINTFAFYKTIHTQLKKLSYTIKANPDSSSSDAPSIHRLFATTLENATAYFSLRAEIQDFLNQEDDGSESKTIICKLDDALNRCVSLIKDYLTYLKQSANTQDAQIMLSNITTASLAAWTELSRLSIQQPAPATWPSDGLLGDKPIEQQFLPVLEEHNTKFTYYREQINTALDCISASS